MTIGSFCCGQTHNVIPDNGLILGTIRTITANTADEIKNRIVAISEGHAKIHDSKVEFKFESTGLLSWNYPEPTKLVEKVAAKFFKLVTNDMPFMVSDDFSFYQNEIPGCYFVLGCGDAEHNKNVHTRLYDFNDKSIPIGVEIYIRILEEKFDLKLI